MSDLALFYGPNAGYVLDLYERYLKDPATVDTESRAYFDSLPPGTPEALAEIGLPSALAATQPSAPGTMAPAVDVARVTAAARLARFIREVGHLGARIEPLGLNPPRDPGLALWAHGLTQEYLTALPSSVVGGPIADQTRNAFDALERLRQAYSGSIGYEDEHIQVADERYWLRNASESGRFFQDIDTDYKVDLLERLTEVDTFERFIHRTFQGAKRFSIEGTDMLVPMLDEIIRGAAEAGTQEIVLGMAHRGRLNVLAHVLGKPYANILHEFDAAKHDEAASVAGKGTQGYSGDVKYHLGFRRAYKESGVHEMPITLVPNPSHLEFVNPVVEGHARAAQETRDKAGPPVQDNRATLPIAIHGDASFPGQGVVPETLNLSNLPGYNTGGTIHIIVNNQIGFTTLARDGRSTLYASDLAKGFEIPIVHVNADDPIACIAAARMAHAYRARFHKDFLIDLIGYRRFGHNEGDAPDVTQPLIYAKIEAHPRVRDKWARELEELGMVSAREAENMVDAVQSRLQEARKQKPHEDASAPRGPLRAGAAQQDAAPISQKWLAELNAALLARPEGFRTNPKLDRPFSRYKAAFDADGGVEWGHAESLAFASILADGTPIRLTGQDSERGTFGHRNLVLHDPTTGRQLVPLQALPQAQASFAVYNSPLSETAALGFEYGYSIHAPGVLVLWEAQFGDFANGAQVIIDQFLASGNAKWRQHPSVVLLLPHGYEGMGPEHSSARLERFLQLCAGDNMRVVNCTTSAQYFHVLRRQAALLATDSRPLVVMTPKSLLRHPRAASPVSDLAHGSFQSIIDDPQARQRADRITRVVLCSGKVYVDLTSAPAFADAERVAAIRVEQLYPFPIDDIKETLGAYPNLRELVWLQEEPRNMGAWSFVSARLREQVEWMGELRYIGRPESASPAEGSISRHMFEQSRIVKAALHAAPEALAPAAVLESVGAMR